MNTYLMRFGGFEMPYNPESISVNKSVNKGTSDDEYTTIVGKGKLFGSDCGRLAAELDRLLRDDRANVLCVPELGSFWAKLIKLDYTVSISPDIIEYSFEFKKQNNVENGRADVYCVTEDENLWHFCERTGCDMTQIVLANQGNLKSYMLHAGDKILLRRSTPQEDTE